MSDTGSQWQNSAEDDIEVTDPNDRDVLCGRGGMTNTHQGNAWYRSLVRANRPLYRASPKHRKILVAKKIVHHVLGQNPPCRFLERRSKDGPWFPVPYKRAVDKTSQALRERERHVDEPIMSAAEAAKVPLHVPNHLPKKYRQNPPCNLILPPQPDFSRTVVRKSGINNSFAIHDHASIPSFAAYAAANPYGVSMQSQPTPAPEASVATRPESRPNSLYQNDNLTTAPKMRHDLESTVDQISSRFWRNPADNPENGNHGSNKKPRTSRYRLPISSLHHDPGSAAATASSERGAADALAALSQVASVQSAVAIADKTPAPGMATNQFLLGHIPCEKSGEVTSKGDGQFADSQDDQFADPEDSSSPPPDEHEEKDEEITDALIPSKIDSNSQIAKPRPSLEAVDETLTEEDYDMQAESARHDNNGMKSSSSDAEQKSSPFLGALCRVCKNSRFHPVFVPEDHYPETHPELIWPMLKPKSRRAITSVLEHCLLEHPHWPVWNTLSNVQKSTKFSASARPLNVLHRSLVAAANESPHELGDRYDTMEKMTHRICRRIGLAEGYITWGPWEAEAAAGAAPSSKNLQKDTVFMLRSYGKALLAAIKMNWSKIEKVSHQEKLDLFNNVFVVPYCVDNVRENGDLFPPVYPSRTGSENGEETMCNSSELVASEGVAS